MGNEQSAIALLLFRVGPVFCCAPANPVQSIIAPPKLTRPPGFSEGKPGIFYHAKHVVSVNDLRHRFGVEAAQRQQPGRMIITLQDDSFIAYWVDEIVEVIDTPHEGWSEPPSHLPQGVFSKTLLLKEKIYLFADFGNFENLPESDYLTHYIDRLTGKIPADEPVAEVNEANHPPPQEPAGTSTAEATTQTREAPRADGGTPAETTRSSPPGKEPHTRTEADHAAIDTGAISPPPAPPDAEADLGGRTENHPPGQEVDPQPSNETTPTRREDEPLPNAAMPNGEDPAHPAVPLEPETVAPSQAADLTDASVPDVTEYSINAAGDTATETRAPDRGDSAAIRAEEEPSPAPGTTQDFLKPVPAVVPESDREPERPPFPWRKLAAALVLFVTVAGMGIYYFWSAGRTPLTYSNPDTHPVVEQAKPATVRDAPVADATRQAEEQAEPEPVLVTDATPDTEKIKPPRPAPVRQDKTEYQAEIKPDTEGVTIVLHSPANEPVLKSPPRPAAPEQSRQKNTPQQQLNPQRKSKPAKEEIIHIVVKGDTLWDIAAHYVKDPYRYPQLARLSKIRNPDRIYPGNRVIIRRHRQQQE